MKSIEKLENLLSVKQQEVLELQLPEETAIIPYVVDDIEKNDVFSIDLLKQDFLLIRTNLLSLIEYGQNLLKQLTVFEASDLKASQIDAITNLQNSIASNLKILTDVYKQILEIQNSKNKLNNEQTEQNKPANVTNNNNMIFTGSTSELLKIITKQG